MSKLLSLLSLELVLTIISEIVKFYGSHLTKSGLMNHFNRDLTPNIKLLKQAVATGEDPKDAILIEGVRPGKTGKGWTESHSNRAHYTFSFCLNLVLFCRLWSSY
jgi:hypothetical protein